MIAIKLNLFFVSNTVCDNGPQICQDNDKEISTFTKMVAGCML